GLINTNVANLNSFNAPELVPSRPRWPFPLAANAAEARRPSRARPGEPHSGRRSLTCRIERRLFFLLQERLGLQRAGTWSPPRGSGRSTARHGCPFLLAIRQPGHLLMPLHP